MSQLDLIPIPKLSDFSEEEQTPAVKLLLGICHAQQEQLAKQATIIEKQSRIIEEQAEQIQELKEQVALQKEEIQCLKDEISRLKGEKGKPNLKASTLNKDNNDTNDNNRGTEGKKKRGKPERKKTKKLKIHKEEIIQPESIPLGARFKGYEDYTVQDIEINLKNTKYRRARYETEEGKQIIGALPKGVSGSHFGPNVITFVLSQYHEQKVPQHLILKQLRTFGIQISSGQLSQLLTEKHESFHQEKEDILRAGLEVSPYIHVDDTGARHKGNNGYCTHIGNELFACFSSTESKSRINFLKLLRTNSNEYIVDDVAREYMKAQGLPSSQLVLFEQDVVLADNTEWLSWLISRGITSKRYTKIATEGALFASLVAHGFSRELVIMSDDAGQFNVTGFLNALCWVHAERTVNKIIPYTDPNRVAWQKVRDQIWNFYRELKNYKLNPSEDEKQRLDSLFDDIFKQKTCFQTLNLALGRIHLNKEELLLVLHRPEIPLHNNLSENDIRDYVTRRKISATTRSDNGRDARDTFLSLKKTCYKLGISFWDYLHDRIIGANLIPPLAAIIRAEARTA